MTTVDPAILSPRTTDEVCTFETDASPPERWTWNASAIERWLYPPGQPDFAAHWEAAGVKWGNVSMDATHIANLIRRGNYEEARVAQLVEPWLTKPIIGATHPDGTTILIDGQHRMIRLFRDGAPTYRAVVLPWALALQFVVDLPGRGTFECDGPRVGNDALGAFLRARGVV